MRGKVICLFVLAFALSVIPSVSAIDTNVYGYECLSTDCSDYQNLKTNTCATSTCSVSGFVVETYCDNASVGNVFRYRAFATNTVLTDIYDPLNSNVMAKGYLAFICGEYYVDQDGDGYGIEPIIYGDIASGYPVGYVSPLLYQGEDVLDTNPYITSVYPHWTDMAGNKINRANLGDMVKMVIAEIPGFSNFEIFEKDNLFNDQIRIVPGSVKDNNLIGIWIITEKDLEPTSDYDEFKFMVGDVISENLKINFHLAYDSDGDGLSDGAEGEIGTDFDDPDTDNDGFSDGDEYNQGTDPLDSNNHPMPTEGDSDGDGLLDDEEAEIGTDSNNPDSDGDGFSDGDEVNQGTDPLNPNDSPQFVDPQLCDLTSAEWGVLETVEGVSVELNVQGTEFCDGKEIKFEVFEDELVGRDPATTNPNDVSFENIEGIWTATGTWIAEWIDDGLLQGHPEYVFKASLVSNSFEFIENDDRRKLIVLPGSGIDPCPFISSCSDYFAESECISDGCEVAYGNVQTNNPLITCGEEGVSCGCAWLSGTCKPFYKVPGDGYIGTCINEESTNNNCNNGFLSYSWISNWTWGEFNGWDEWQDGPSGDVNDYVLDGGKYYYDSYGGFVACQDGSTLVECTASIQVGFFGGWNFIIVIIILVCFYFLREIKKK